MVDYEKIKELADLPPADLKIILLGDSAVGKSKIVERFLMDNYEKRQLSTYALTMYRHNHNLNGKESKVDIWDTAGQDCFDELHPSYYFGAHACALVFDITRKLTYQHLAKWYSEMRRYCPHIPCILIANKIDVDPRVVEKKFNFSAKHDLPLHFVSAANGTNVVKIFDDLLDLALDNKMNPPDALEADIMDLLNEDDFFAKEEDK